jgi:uncharacterized protein YdiU (UPF0061 family)
LFASASERELGSWIVRWRQRLQEENRSSDHTAKAINNVNPAFIPRNHRVEKAIQRAVEGGDFTEMDRLITLFSKPYQDRPEYVEYMKPPKPEERVYQTFCGT